MCVSILVNPYKEPTCVITMPTRSPDVVTEHRVTLGRWERERVKESQDAINIALLGTGIGVASLGVGGTYCAYKIGKAIYDWGEDIVDSTLFQTGLGILRTPENMAENLRTGGESEIKSSGLLYLLSGGLLGKPAGQ